MINLKHVSLDYDDENAVKDITLDIDQGTVLSILGASGSGKTSLLSLISGLKSPSEGTVVVCNSPLLKPRQETGVILQDYGLFPWKSVYENIAFTLRLRKVKDYDRIVRAHLTKLGLEDYAKRYPHQLSGGQKQRVAIGRALALDSDLLLMDESFSALDSLTKESLQDLLLELHKEKKLTIIFVTHNIEEAVFMGSRILIMEKGKIKQDFNNDFQGQRDSNEFYEMCHKVRACLHE